MGVSASDVWVGVQVRRDFGELLKLVCAASNLSEILLLQNQFHATLGAYNQRFPSKISEKNKATSLALPPVDPRNEAQFLNTFPGNLNDDANVRKWKVMRVSKLKFVEHSVLTSRISATMFYIQMLSHGINYSRCCTKYTRVAFFICSLTSELWRFTVPRVFHVNEPRSRARINSVWVW